MSSLQPRPIQARGATWQSVTSAVPHVLALSPGASCHTVCHGPNPSPLPGGGTAPEVLGISSGAALDLWRPEARGELPEGADPPGALQRALRGRTLLPAEVIGSFFLHRFGHSQTSLLPFFSHTVRLPITRYRPLLQGPTPASSLPSQRQASRESRGRFPGVF